MADELDGSSLGGMLSKKYGPLPLWTWVTVVSVVGGFLWYRHNQNAAASSTTAASSSDLGTANNAQTLFGTAGVMPYQGGDVYINGVQQAPANTAPTTSTGSTTTTAPATSTPVSTSSAGSTPTTAKSSVTAPGKPIQYRVRPGDTLSSIAKRYGTTWQKLWTYNTTTGNRPASTIATLKKRGPNRLFSNELILIPQ